MGGGVNVDQKFRVSGAAGFFVHIFTVTFLLFIAPLGGSNTTGSLNTNLT